jgi:Fungal Zn(2)-Cys(6) binuclear cluster domain
MRGVEDDKHPRKARRISRACDYCHHRSIRCRASSEGDGSRCQNCVDFEQACTYDRPVKRRGAKVRLRSGSATTVHTDRNGTHQVPASASSSLGSVNGALHTSFTAPITSRPDMERLNGNVSVEWRAPRVASQAVIMDLVEIYFEVVYPM